ncbi:hypothetical protein [Streptomyces atroolivaceus]|uniref:hypothetical protein n=1 Tax=Streptomyces atroolivaceus TaxID=66869 RepID=UPI0036A3E005
MAARKTTPPPAAKQEPQQSTDSPAAPAEPQPPAVPQLSEPTAPPEQATQPSEPPAPPETEASEEDDQAVEEPRERTAVEAAYVDALQREREGYTRYGRKDRAAAVEDELKRLGAPFERAVPPPRETA